MSSEEEKGKISKLEWIQLRKEMSEFEQEPGLVKLTRKFKDNPLIPLGVIVTCGAFIYGLKFMMLGDKRNSQNMMRLRVGAQAFTIGVSVASIYYTTKKNKKAQTN